MKPNEVNKKKSQELLDIVFNNIKIAAPGKFKVGDKVRISKCKYLFSKSYLPSWTIEVFEIDKVKQSSPVVHHLRDYQGQKIEGTIYEQELL